MDLERISQIVITVVGIAAVILVGYMVIQRMNNDYCLVEGFCMDKEGVQNVSMYDNFLDYDVLNCSNKENYGIFTEMIA